MKSLTMLAIGTTFGLITFGAMAEDGQKCEKGECPNKKGKAAHFLDFNMDADGDGTVTDDERQAAREVMREKMAERKAAVLKNFDTDGNGELSEDERKAARAAFAKHHGEGRRGGLFKKGKCDKKKEDAPQGT